MQRALQGALRRFRTSFVLLLALVNGSAHATRPGDSALGWLVMDVSLTGWQFSLLVLAALAGPVWLGTTVARRLAAAWRGYRMDEFLGIRWRWRYRGDMPTAIDAFCPADDTQLIYHYSQSDNEVLFRCETCNREYGSFAGDAGYVRGIVRRQIERKLRTGEWQEADAS